MNVKDTILATEAQQKVIDSCSKFKFVSCAAGSGMSFLSALLAKNFDGDVVIVVPSIASIKQIGGDEHIKQVLLADGGRFLESENIYVPERSPRFVKFLPYEQFVEQRKSLSADLVIYEQADRFPRDFLKTWDSRIPTVILSYVTFDDTHPCRKIALKALLGGKRYMSVENGFPYLANHAVSLVDVTGNCPVEVETFRMHLEDNHFLMKACPDYKDRILQQPYKERTKYQGVWTLRD